MPATQSPPPAAKLPPPRPVFTFTCAACEAVQIRPTPDLPSHWTIERVAGRQFAYCGTCSIDLPGTAQ